MSRRTASARWRALGLALALSCAPAVADWTAVGRGNEIYSAFADLESIRRSGDLVHMHGLYDFRRRDYTPDGRALFSTAVLREYDCAGQRVRLVSAVDFSGHMGEGEVVSASARTGRWEQVVSGGIDESFLRLACARP